MKQRLLTFIPISAIILISASIDLSSLFDYDGQTIPSYVPNDIDNTPNNNIFLNRVEELPLYTIIGIIGGILGGTFIRLWKRVQLWRGSGPNDKPTKLLQVVILSLVSSTIMYYIPLMEWTCHEDYYRVLDDFDIERNNNIFHSRQFDCPTGQINNLANIMFGSRLSAISSILTNPNQFTIKTLLTVGCVFYPLMTISLGVAIPSGKKVQKNIYRVWPSLLYSLFC